MDIDRDLLRLALQEQLLQPTAFTEATAWTLGSRIKALCEARQLAVAIEVRRASQTLFFYSMPGATPNHADWARRKRNSVELFQRSSYALGLGYQKEGSTLEQKLGLPTRDYANHGGSFPIRVPGTGCIGALTVSGLPQRDDHALVVQALAELCGIPLPDVALDRA